MLNSNNLSRKSNKELEEIINTMLEEISKVLYLDEKFNDEEKIHLIVKILEKEYNTVI